jgi:hypothetical protein
MLIILGLSILLIAVIYFFTTRRNKRHLAQLQLIAAHYGQQVLKQKYKKGLFIPKVQQVTGGLDGYESKLYGYVVSAGNSYVQMTAFEMEIPFLKDLTVIIAKENVLSKALKNIAGEGFVTRDDAFDDVFKIRTNKSLLIKQLLLDESLREKMMEKETLVKGRFIIKGSKLRYEEVYSIEKDKHRLKFQDIIDLSRLLVAALKSHLVADVDEIGQIEIKDFNKEGEKLPEILDD